MAIGRIVKHLLITRWALQRAFPEATLGAIEQAIRACERTHYGEICFAVELALDLPQLWHGTSPREHALDVFSRLRIWDTQRNNGVLIYVLLADRDVEIVADRGIHEKVGAAGWEEICRVIEQAFRQGDFRGGALRGVELVAQKLALHFPATGENVNEYPDKPVIL